MEKGRVTTVVLTCTSPPHPHPSQRGLRKGCGTAGPGWRGWGCVGGGGLALLHPFCSGTPGKGQREACVQGNSHGTASAWGESGAALGRERCYGGASDPQQFKAPGWQRHRRGDVPPVGARRGALGWPVMCCAAAGETQQKDGNGRETETEGRSCETVMKKLYRIEFIAKDGW